MIRTLTGTIFWRACGNDWVWHPDYLALPEDEGDLLLIALTDVRDRRLAAPPAPPNGLCLTKVGYDEPVF